VAVGGTSLLLDGSNHIASETAWNDGPNSSTGGGISVAFTAPPWQASLGISNPGSMRLVPDVSLNADPNTGYLVYSSGFGFPVGGTSASCPMWAGATALLESLSDQQSFPKRQGILSAALYPAASLFHDITLGDNRQPGTGSNYVCQVGYDLVTGLGTTDFFGIGNGLLTTVSGTVTLSGSASMAQPLTFEFRSTGNPSFSRTLTPDASGAFSLTVARGSYNLAIQGSKWLRKVVAADASAGPVSGLTVTLTSGDINGDNAVNIQDLGLLADAFNATPASPNWNANADLNGDGKVNIADLGLLADGFGQRGDP
jgi:subtilase family serine protease